jgi:hypothetical protein
MSYPKKIYAQGILFLFSVFLFLFLASGFSSYFSLRDSGKYGIIIIFIILYYPLNKKLVNWIYSLSESRLGQEIKNIKNGKRGYEGEDEVNLWLEDIVGKDNIIRNVKLPNYKFDIDAVVVCNKGVIIVEIKNLTNEVCFKKDEYYYQKDGKWITLSLKKDPRYKLKNRTYKLRSYLIENGFGSVYINKVLVFSNGKFSFKGKPGIFIAGDKGYLKNYIEKLPFDSNCTPEICEKIKSLLKKHSKF